MAEVATPAEILAHAAALEAAADYTDFRDRGRERRAETALARRIAARLRMDYGGRAAAPSTLQPEPSMSISSVSTP